MKRGTTLLILSMFMLIASTSRAQEELGWQGFTLDLRHLESRTDLFHMFADGKKVGSWSWTVEKSEDKITFKDISILDGQLREDATMEVNRKTLNSYSFKMKMTSSAQGWTLSNDIVWKDNHARGKIVREGGEQGGRTFDIDSKFEETVPREIFIGLLPALELQTGQSRRLKFFNPLFGQTWDIEFEVRKPEMVKVPAGEFDTTPVALLKQGAQGVSNIFYLTRSMPRRVVKVDVLEQNLSIELMKL